MPISMAMASLIGAGVSAGTRLAGGMMADSATKEANRVAAAQAKQSRQYQRKMDRKNIELQKQFAQEGIRWRVADAEAAGIHPLYALGAQTTSFNPVSVGGLAGYSPTPETGLAQALADSGQDVSRAIHATRTQSERDNAYLTTARQLTLQKLGLENELLGAQIAKLATTRDSPPMAELGEPLPEVPGSPRNEIQLGGFKWLTSPNTTNAQDIQTRYGDEGPIAWAAGVPALLDDLWRNSVLGRYVYGEWPFKP